MSLTFWELSDQVHCYHFEWECVIGGWDVKSRNSFPVCEVFVLLTGGTSFYEVGYPGIHSWPSEVAGYLADGFVLAWMSCCWCVVILLCDIGS